MDAFWGKKVRRQSRAQSLAVPHTRGLVTPPLRPPLGWEGHAGRHSRTWPPVAWGVLLCLGFLTVPRPSAGGWLNQTLL